MGRELRGPLVQPSSRQLGRPWRISLVAEAGLNFSGSNSTLNPHFPDEPRWYGMRFAPDP